jgi:hypothetical protein
VRWNDHFRGGLSVISASLLLLLSSELLKWQFPINAVVEKAATIAVTLRSLLLPASPQPIRR